MIISVADRVYSFKSDPSLTYPSQAGSAYLPRKSDKAGSSPLQSHQAQRLSLISSVPPPDLSLEPVRMEVKDYINIAISEANLQDGEKKQLRQLLKSYPQSYTN